MSSSNFDFGQDDTPPAKGPIHYADTMHDIHAAERGPWEDGHRGEPEHCCWVRRRGEPWKMIGTATEESDAHDLFVKCTDLLVTSFLVLHPSDGDPNSFSSGARAKRIRKRSTERTKPLPPLGQEERVAYYEKLIENGKQLFE